VAVNAKQALWEMSPFWLKEMSEEQAKEAGELLRFIVDDWMAHLADWKPPPSVEEAYGRRYDEFQKLRKGGPAERLATLRLEVFKTRLERLSHRAFARAKQIVDGEATQDEAEGQELLDQIDELRRQAPQIDPANQSGAEMQLGEAFLEANFIRRGGPFNSMRMGHYLAQKKR
jgi:hypothetical protein